MKRPLRFLGFHAFLWDSSAALVRDGEVVAAVSEERLNREKHSRGDTVFEKPGEG